MKKNLLIINNEKCLENTKGIFCENLEIKSVAEQLQKYFNVNLVLRKSSKISTIHEIKNNQINLSNNIISFLKDIFKFSFKKNYIYLIISVTPYTFLSFLILFFLRKKIFLYLRSDGQKEITLIFGRKISFLYKLVQDFMVKYCISIVANKEILKNRNFHLVTPSQIDESWYKDTYLPNIETIRLLYVGRLKVEKGVYFLVETFKKIKLLDERIFLTLIGHGNKIDFDDTRIQIQSGIGDKNLLIKKYDEHNITILPSFTEAHPQVLLESLVRKRPIIIFEDIAHVKKSYKGVYVSKRNTNDLLKTIKHIISDYSRIVNEMNENRYPSKQDFILQLKKIFSS